MSKLAVQSYNQVHSDDILSRKVNNPYAYATEEYFHDLFVVSLDSYDLLMYQLQFE